MKPFRIQPRQSLLLPGARSVKVALGYPYGPITAPFMHSLRALREYEVAKMARGDTPLVRYELPQGGIYVDHNRNTIAERFFQTDADWLLQIDTDIEFPPQIVEMMLAVAGHTKKILAASVPLGPPFGSCAWMKTDVPGIFACLRSEDITEDGIQVDAVASAILLVHREVFEAIADREGQRWFLKMAVGRLDDPLSATAWAGPDGRIRDRKFIPMGEDLAFCIRAAEAGYQSWCAKLPGLKHHKSLPMSHDYEEEPSALIGADVADPVVPAPTAKPEPQEAAG